MNGELLLTNNTNNANNPRRAEAILFCLSQIHREVTTRCKLLQTISPSLKRDRDATQQVLLSILNQLVTSHQPSSSTPHRLLQASLDVCGKFSPCYPFIPSFDASATSHLIHYLQACIPILPSDAAKSLRALYVSSVSKQSPAQLQAQSARLHILVQSVGATLRLVSQHTSAEAPLTQVAEGSTRLLLHAPNLDPAASIANELLQPILQQCYASLNQLQVTSPSQSNGSHLPRYHHLLRYLATIQVMVRFCDAPDIVNMGPMMLQNLLTPEGSSILDRCVQASIQDVELQANILPKVIQIHQQLLQTVPTSILAPIIPSTLTLVVDVFTQTQQACCLKYFATAVETFGPVPETHQSFAELLQHVTGIIVNTTNHSTKDPEVSQAYFECLQRYTLYCPAGFLWKDNLETAVTVAVHSLTGLEGEKASTRACLLFLSQLIGWNVMRLSDAAKSVFATGGLGDLVFQKVVMQHGQRLCMECLQGLLGGGPQMLTPAYSDCVCSIVQCMVLPLNDHHQHQQQREELVSQWLYTAIATTTPSSNNNLGSAAAAVSPSQDSSNNANIVSTLIQLAKLPKNHQARSKMKQCLSDLRTNKIG